ncbi:MAG TPA: hypothetical protein VGG33_29150 [Polyangia bacterium]
MPTVEELQTQHEAAIDGLLARLTGKGTDSDWALVRALIHRAVHVSAERKAAEYCAVATFLAEMIGHAHSLHHPGDRADASHEGRVH